jgi:hypothetical protein
VIRYANKIESQQLAGILVRVRDSIRAQTLKPTDEINFPEGYRERGELRDELNLPLKKFACQNAIAVEQKNASPRVAGPERLSNGARQLSPTKTVISVITAS